MRLLSLFRKLKYFKSIDEMPIYNWFKLQETNELTHLLKVKKLCSKREVLILQNALQSITNEYIDFFGINDQYKKILELKRNIRIKEIQLITTGERINKTFIKVLKSELNLLIQSAQKSDTGNVSVHVNKYMGYRIDLKSTSVKEFYSILNHIKKEAEASYKQ